MSPDFVHHPQPLDSAGSVARRGSDHLHNGHCLQRDIMSRQTSGLDGDSKIALEQQGGVNKYNCSASLASGSFSSLISALTMDDSWTNSSSLNTGSWTYDASVTTPNSGNGNSGCPLSLPPTLKGQQAILANRHSSMLRPMRRRSRRSSMPSMPKGGAVNRFEAGNTSGNTILQHPRRRGSSGTACSSNSTEPSPEDMPSGNAIGADLLNEESCSLKKWGASTTRALTHKYPKRTSMTYFEPTMEEADDEGDATALPTSPQKARMDSLSRLSFGTLAEQDDLLAVKVPSSGPSFGDIGGADDDNNDDDSPEQATDNITSSTAGPYSRPVGRKSIDMYRKSLDLDEVWHNPTVQYSVTLDWEVETSFSQIEQSHYVVRPKKRCSVNSSLTMSSNTFLLEDHSFQQPLWIAPTTPSEMATAPLLEADNTITSTATTNGIQLLRVEDPISPPFTQHISSKSSMNALRFFSLGNDSPTTTFLVGNELKTIPSHFGNSTVNPCSQPVRRSSEHSTDYPSFASLGNSLSSIRTDATRPRLIPAPPTDAPILGTSPWTGNTSPWTTTMSRKLSSTKADLVVRPNNPSSPAAPCQMKQNTAPMVVMDRTLSQLTQCSDAPSMPTRRASVETVNTTSTSSSFVVVAQISLPEYH